jgi:hypothetical protein
LIKLRQSLAQGDKKFTRGKAERALAAGADPNQKDEKDVGIFTEHTNYHVRVRAWHLQGRPLPDDTDAQNQFLLKLQGEDMPRDSAKAEQLIALLRARYIKDQTLVAGG